MNSNYFLVIAQSVYVISLSFASARVLKRKSSEDFSVWAVMIAYVGVVSMFAYSVNLMMTKQIYALFFQNLVNLVTNTINTGIVLYYHPSLRKK